MDNTSIGGNYSLSTTHLTNPITESTCLNSSNPRTKFNWGEGTISPRSRNNSHSIVDSTTKSSINNDLPSKAWLSPSSTMSKIDPRTYVDIRSNGLASRIVKYHENSSRLNRSLSMSNLYNKPGQFPVVHLKKNDQQYKAKKTKNLSMTRIAAPEKSAFHGNTLSSILRSGSIVGLQKTDEEISRENRPILHPPPSENEMAPTRSVLEVLKEISRKRINSDEMDGTELTKKQCKEPDQDAAITNVNMSLESSQSKRQREKPTFSSYNAQLSPEQVIKKRMCSYNNDILSSLSSSMKNQTKKKIFEIQNLKRTASELVTSSNESFDFGEFCNNNGKQHCVEPTTTTSTIGVPLSSHPSAPVQSSSNEHDGGSRCGIVARRASEPVLPKTKPKLTLFNKDYDEAPIVNNNEFADNKEDDDLCGIQFVKPKKSSSISSVGTLLMEKTKKSKLALMLSGLRGELDDEEDEVDAIAPKADQSKSLEVPVTTQANTISLNNTSVSVSSALTTPTAVKTAIQSKPTSETDAPTKPISKPITFGAKSDTTILPSLTSTTPTTQPTAVVQPQAATTTVATSTPVTAATTTTPLGGFSFGLSNDKPKTIPTTSAPAPAAVASILTLTTTASKAPLPTTATQSLAGSKPFTFGVAAPAPTTTSTTSGFNFGGTTTSLAQTVPSTNAFTLANATPTTKATAVFDAPAAATASQPSFTFGSLASTTTNSSTMPTTSPPTTSALTPSFGSLKNTFTAPPAFGNTNNGIVAFGGAGNVPTTPQITTATKPAAGGFSFGLTPTVAAAAPTEAPKSVFGNTVAASTTVATVNTTFSFSATKPPANSTAFTFGAASNPTPTPNPTPTFGSTAAAAAAPPPTAASPANIFGNTSIGKPSNTFTFGSSSSNTVAAAVAPAQNNAFSFSSTDKTTSATGNSIGGGGGGFAFNSPSTTFTPNAEGPKNMFAAATDSKPAFNFGATNTTNSNLDNNKPVVFGGATNIFGAPAQPASQNSTFTFGASANGATNAQGSTTATPNLFGSAAVPSTNLTGSSNSMFGAPASSTATFNFGSANSSANNTIKPEPTKPTTGGFVFGSTSSIGSNATKTANAVDMNKTFVFGGGGDSNTTTTAKPAVLPSSTTNIFGNGGNAINTVINGSTENKVFSFGGAPATGLGNNTFNAGQPSAVNPAPAFNFGAVAPLNNTTVPVQGTDRPIKKATRRLHKT